MILNRRHIVIAAGFGMAGLAVAGQPRIHVWRGFAMGADAEIRIAGLNQRNAEALAARASAEITRLEKSFSLFDPSTELSVLNAAGRLDRPSHDFRLLLDRSLAFWRGTDGAFNPAIQPLWRKLAEHFATSSADPAASEITEALSRCNPADISITDGGVRLKPGMALSFNGIAQGYITDRVADLFRAEGLNDILLNLGEIRALPGRDWDIGIAGSAETVALTDAAIAQSAGRGTPFTADGRWHHLLDPATGHSALGVKSVTVAAPTATEADALSTALYVTHHSKRTALAQRFPSISMWIET